MTQENQLVANETKSNPSDADIFSGDVDQFKVAVDLLRKSYRKKLDAITPEMFALPDQDLEDQLCPTPQLRQIRQSFWEEIARCIHNHDVFHPVNVYKGISSGTYWFEYVCNDPLRFAFVLRPVSLYDKKAPEIVDFGMSRLREALEAKIIYPNGYLDAKATKVILEIVQHFENRIKGTVEQKLKIQSLSMNVNAEMKVNDKKDIDEKLEALKRKIAQYEGAALTHELPERAESVIDVGELSVEASESRRDTVLQKAGT